MKRLLAVILALSVAACGSQQRPDDGPDFSPEPYSPDETPEPRLGEIESLISQAKLEIKRRDYDEARVKLHQVFRRDRWHPEANTLYQDLQISRGKGDALYQEYLDLYEANKQRGDALWFHLRPLLIKRGIKACEVEKHPDAVDIRDDLEAVQSAIRNWKKGTVTHAEIELLLRVKPGDPQVHMLRIQEFVKAGRQKEAVALYKTYSEENPQSGDALYLYALTVFHHEIGPVGEMKALNLLRSGWILELPGAHLPVGIARVAYAKIAYDLEPAGLPRIDALFDKPYGLLNVALNFFRIAALSTPGADFSEDIKRVLDLAARHKFELEDLSLRK